MATWAENDALSRREYEDQKVVLKSRPQFLIVDPTSVCNARCVMCPVSFRPPDDLGTDMPLSTFEKLKVVLPVASHINLFATGEPTVAKEILHFVEEAKKRSHSHALIWLSTNGKRVPDDVLDSVMDDPRVGLQFSVDGGTREVFEAIRRGITFDQMCGTLERAKARRGTKPYPRFSFSSTISKRNVHDLASIFALAKKYDVDQVIFYEMDPESPEEEQYVLDETDRPVFEAQLAFIDGTGIPYSNGLQFRGAAPTPPPANEPLRCHAPWKVFYARADGGVRTCCTLRSSMGDLGSRTFEDVWNGEEFVGLRRAFVEQSGIPSACLTCTDPLRTWGT